MPRPAARTAEGVRAHQPYLHDRVVVLQGPTVAISLPGGDMVGGCDGLFHDDRRVLSHLEVAVRETGRGDGSSSAPVAPVPIDVTLGTGGTARFLAVLAGVGEHSADPAVTMARLRAVAPGLLTETVVLANAGGEHVRLEVAIRLEADLATMAEVKAGTAPPPLVALGDGPEVTWRQDGSALRAVLDASEGRVSAGQVAGVLGWEVSLPPGATCTASLRATAGVALPPLFPAAASRLADRVEVRTPDLRLERLVARALADLDDLTLHDPDGPTPDAGAGAGAGGEGEGDVFVAAGAPWFLTLFGRDSLWAARMLLPVTTGVARGTLRTLARRQGRHVDPATGEAPGKIIHEVRRPDRRAGAAGSALPPLYYGTIDATPLWLTLLHDAWRWGMDEADVESLLDPAEAALRWMRDHGDADGDGLLEYVDSSGRGLVNQGWRDSSDAIRWRDGALAAAPLALAEVQAYAFEAACAGATLLDAFGRPGADEWRSWADRLRARFDAAFWVDGPGGPLPAIALDADKRAADAVTSALGHLLGTGLLDAEREAVVAARLAAPDLDCGFGLRTLSSDSVGYNPLGYHTGSVWPHDTAIAVRGLRRSGHPDGAAALIEGLLAASEAFDGRLPELFGGHGRGAWSPAPYPAACRPQAWSAASAVSLLADILGLTADAPAGWVQVDPLPSAPVPLHVRGLAVAGHGLDVELTGDGAVLAGVAGSASIEVRRGRPHPPGAGLPDRSPGRPERSPGRPERSPGRPGGT